MGSVKVTQSELPDVPLPIPCLMGRCPKVAIIDGTNGIGRAIDYLTHKGG